MSVPVVVNKSGIMTPLPPHQARHTKVRDIFIFAPNDWGREPERPQRFALGLAAAGRRVFFLSRRGVDAPLPGYQIDTPDERLPLYRVSLHLRGEWTDDYHGLTENQLTMVRSGMGALLRDLQALSSISIVFHAGWFPIVRVLPNSYQVFDYSQRDEKYDGGAAALTELERETLAAADLVTVSTEGQKLHAARYSRQVALIEDGIDLEEDSAPCICSPLSGEELPEERQIVGYLGTLGDWIDTDLVRSLAVSYPRALLLLVGEDRIDAAQRLADVPNVKIVEPQADSGAGSYLKIFDVCIFPFRTPSMPSPDIRRTIGSSLAMGRPVVAAGVHHLLPADIPASTTDQSRDFIEEVGNALRQSGAESVRSSATRRAYAARCGWKTRSVQILEASAQIKMPRVSVVILCFNNKHLTRDCLNSVLEKSDYPDLEIIVVDNASTDGTPQYIQEMALQHPEIRPILNNENIGFAAGNNVGLAAATGDYLVLLNNDTVVTEGWVMTLVRHFQRAPRLGLLGPVTNNIGNEARIDTHYANIDQMPAAVLGHTLSNMGRLYPMSNAAFFCVMMSRSTYEQCGPISEDYGRGFFEDDDYCRKVEAAGLQIGCAEDVFVHHHLSASFNQISDRTRRVLFERNRFIYERKWGEWIPHFYRP